MLRLKFFIFLGVTIVLAWLGFSQVFSKWADQAQADAQALTLQTARAVVAQLPVSPYASLARAPTLKQALAAFPGPNATKAMQELSKRLPELLAEAFPGWGAEDIALLAEKNSDKTQWLKGYHWLEKAPEGYLRHVVQDAAHRREAVEMGDGLKMFFSIEPPAGVDSSLSLWIGGPVIRSWESSLGQELRRTSALGLGVVASGKLVMQVGQSSQPNYLSALNKVVSSIQPDSAGVLKGTKEPGGGFISTLWGTSKQFATDKMAARQSMDAGKVELVVVLGNKATQEALLGAQQGVFYGWLAILLVGVLVGFVVFPSKPKVVPSEDMTETMEQIASPPSHLLAADEPKALRKITLPPAEDLPPSPPVVSEEITTLKETGALEVVSEKPETEPMEQAFALPSSPPSRSVFAPSFVVTEGAKALEEAAPKAEGLPEEVSLPDEPFLSSRLLEFLKPHEPQVSPAPSLELPRLQEEPIAVGLHGKAVQPEELLGVDHAPHENPAAVFEATLRAEAERFLGADFLPEHSSLAGEALSASAAEGPEIAEWRNVFAEFLRVRKQCNQDTESLNFERFKAKLEVSKNNLLAKHHCKTVRFLVQIKDGKAAIKAIPVRD